jgi:hypothetical protein
VNLPLAPAAWVPADVDVGAAPSPVGDAATGLRGGGAAGAAASRRGAGAAGAGLAGGGAACLGAAGAGAGLGLGATAGLDGGAAGFAGAAGLSGGAAGLAGGGFCEKKVSNKEGQVSIAASQRRCMVLANQADGHILKAQPTEIIAPSCRQQLYAIINAKTPL